MNLMSESWDKIANFCETTGEFFEGAGKVVYYIFHPVELGALMWDGIVVYSFVVATVAMVILILYYSVSHSEKIKKWLGYIGLTYVIIQAINTYI